MLPLLAAGVGLSIGGLYSVGKAYDNFRFWEDYRRNTHRSPKYPWRSGYYDSFGYYANAVKELGYSAYLGY